MIALAWVLRNRVFAGWGDWYDVAMNAPTKRGAIYDDWRVDLRNSQVRFFLTRIDDIHNGTEVEDMVNGALYYTEAQMPQTEWFKNMILRDRKEHPMLAKVGPIHFFG